MGLPLDTERLQAGLLLRRMEKRAFPWARVAPALGAWGTASFHDLITQPGDSPWYRSLFPLYGTSTEGARTRNLMTVLNFALGGLGSHGVRSQLASAKTLGADLAALRAATPQNAAAISQLTGARIKAQLAAGAAGASGILTGPLIKDLVIPAHKTMHAVSEAQKDLRSGISALREGLATSKVNPWLLGGLGLAGAGAVGGGAWALQKAIRDKAEAPIFFRQEQGGRLRVTLPTTNKHDAETVLDLPFDKDVNLSRSLYDRLGIDVRRRLRGETSQRIKRRGQDLDLNLSPV
jgi:hypothetical protein